MEPTKIFIVTGCMAIQTYKGNIKEEELFHNVLKDFIWEKHHRILNFKIITYNELSLCYDKFIDRFESNPADLIIFQVRGHYYLQIVNYFTTYQTIERIRYSKGVKSNKYTKTSNFLFLIKNKLRNGNNFIYIILWKIFAFIIKEFKQPFGYFWGYLTGAERFAMKEYKKLIINISCYSKDKNIPLLFLGVTSRPISKIENLLSRRLNKFSKRLIKSLNGTYIDIFGEFTSNNEYKFVNSIEDKISLNKIGHKDVAKKTAKAIEIFFN